MTMGGTVRLFYLILLVSPMLGWASASAHKLPVSPAQAGDTLPATFTPPSCGPCCG